MARLFLSNNSLTVTVFVFAIIVCEISSQLLGIDKLMPVHGVAAQEQQAQTSNPLLLDSLWDQGNSAAESALLLFYDDSERSRRILSEFEVTKTHFAALEGEESVSFASVNVSETSAGMDLAQQEFSIVSYPTLKWIVHGVTCDFLGGLSSKNMIRWISSRVENSIVFLYDYDDDSHEDTNVLKDHFENAKGNADLVVIGFFDWLRPPADMDHADMDAFVAVSQEDRGLDCTFIAMENTDKARRAAGLAHTNESSTSNSGIPSTDIFAIHRTFSQTTTTDSAPIRFESSGRSVSSKRKGIRRQALHRFVAENRVPLVPIYSDKNAAAILTSAYHYYVFILVQSYEFVHSTTATASQSLIQDVIEDVAKSFRLGSSSNNSYSQVRFVAVPYNDADTASKQIFHFFDLEPTDTPAIRMLSTKQNNNNGGAGVDGGESHTIDEHDILKYNEPLDGYTVEGVTSFVRSHINHHTHVAEEASDSRHRANNHGDEL